MSVSINFHHDFGLANRLFIFSAAYAYAKKHNKKLTFLHEFYHHFTIHSRTDYTHIFFSDIPFNSITQYNNVNRYNDKLFCKFDEIPPMTREDLLLLLGCYQSEKYFQEYAQDLYKRFSCSAYIKNQLLNFYPQLSRGCFIHVRRGDFLVLKNYDLNLFDHYYPSAISKIRKQYHDTYFYVLSNDLEWCRNNDLLKCLKNENSLEFIESNEVVGLWIMQLCKYGGICANSTYSWWGGWLNKMTHIENNTVLFPSRVLNDDADYTDLISNKFEVIQV